MAAAEEALFASLLDQKAAEQTQDENRCPGKTPPRPNGPSAISRADKMTQPSAEAPEIHPIGSPHVGRFELVIFDNDGVLVDSEPIANRILAELLTASGWPTTYEDSLRDYMGGSLKLVRDTVEPQLGRALPAELEDQYHQLLFTRMRTELTAVSAVREALEQIELPVCVASSGAHPRIELALKTVGLFDRFAGHIYSADDVERGKPNPDLFLYAASQLGIQPEHCVVIEDSPLGVTAAKAAGMTVIGYAGMTPAERLKDADVIIDTMTQLVQTIRDLDNA